MRVTPILIIVYIILTISLPLMCYNNEAYPLQRDVIAHLKLAKTVNDLKQIREELELALAGLEPYHGNPAWVFPDPTTDFDYIRSKLKEQIEAIKAVEDEDPSSYGYQRLIKNTKYAIDVMEKMVGATIRWKLGTPLNIVLIISWFVVVLPLTYVLGEEVDEWLRRRR